MPRRRPGLRMVALFAAFSALAFGLYAPALHGPFLSDDLHYVSQNPFVQSLGLANLIEIWNPRGVLPAVVENYAPVHLTLHALVWALFGSNVVGHHVVNVLLHALAATLLAVFLRRIQMPTFAAIAGASLFLVHPANVEAVAWISQLKSPASLALALGALCLHPRRPACAVLLFTAALFAKPTAAFALPVLVGLRLIERQVGSVQQTPKADAREWYWVGASLLAFLAFCVAEISAFEGAAGHLDPLDPDPFVTARTIVALFARYLAMAVAGVGTSTFHEPARAVSALDPWWLAGLALMVLCTVRVWTGLRLVWPVLRRKTEANPRIRERALESLCWIWVFAAFAPISQVFPFRYPMADRYLYSLLPGLIGAVLCALAPCWRKGGGRLGARAPGAAALGLALLFSFQAYARAGVWASPERVMLDAARHYPDGVSALQLRARAAARRGDREGALAALRAAVERGYDGYEGLLRDAALAPLRDDPEFRSIVHAMAAFWIARASRSVEPSQADLLSRSRAHAARGEWAEAVRDLEHAIGQRGPLAGIATRELISARAHLRAAE